MRNPFFCSTILHGFFEDLVLHGLLPEQTLELSDLLDGSSQLGGWNNILTGGDRRERAFLELLTPFEKLVGVDVVQASYMRDGHSGLKGLLHDGDLFRRRRRSAPVNIDGRPGLPSPQSMKVSQVEIAAIDPDFTEATASIPDGIR